MKLVFAQKTFADDYHVLELLSLPAKPLDERPRRNLLDHSWTLWKLNGGDDLLRQTYLSPEVQSLRRQPWDVNTMCASN
jgi:hypothetical protein